MVMTRKIAEDIHGLGDFERMNKETGKWQDTTSGRVIAAVRSYAVSPRVACNTLASGGHIETDFAVYRIKITTKGDSCETQD